MIAQKRVLALIPARSGSKGLPGKNSLDLCGRPLLGWPIQAAKGSRYIDRVICSTDTQELAEIARAQGAEVPFLRPAELATDKAPSAGFIEHALKFLEERGELYEYLVLLEPTSPLTTSADVDQALATLEARRDVADSIVGVSKVEAAHPQFDVLIDERGLLVSYLDQGFQQQLRRQEIPDVYFREGSLYISDVRVFLERKRFYHERTLPYITPKWKAIEVDDLVDFICIEAIMNNLARIQQSKPHG